MVEEDSPAERQPAEMSEVSSDEFGEFFVDRHRSMVRALSLALGNAELGRDAAAEGFTRALQRWNRVSTYDNPSGWVYRVGLNWGRSRRRKTRREVVGVEQEDRAAPQDGLDAAEACLRTPRWCFPQ